ncbi:MAG: DUF1465 family protein [Pseudomonadota bacterium]
MNENNSNDHNGDVADSPVRLADRFFSSGRFKALFNDGMALVEESATYLDGEGRRVAKSLTSPASVLYASESMRLTTRLMQMASWLLLQRAVSEGEMTREQAMAEKNKVRLDQLSSKRDAAGWDSLPEEFISLVDRSLSLQASVTRLDLELFGGEEKELNVAKNPVSAQLNLLSTALGASISD